VHRTRNALLASGVTLAISATGAAAAVLSLDPDGVHLEAPFLNGGRAHLELEDRGTRAAICFVWDNPAPQDGDSLASRILTRAGSEVVDLGTGDQWIHGAGEGCETPPDDRYRDVFAHPSDYVVEVRVVEEQGTPPTPPVRSEPLRPASQPAAP
jgi:hypothetical protein